MRGRWRYWLLAAALLAACGKEPPRSEGTSPKAGLLGALAVDSTCGLRFRPPGILLPVPAGNLREIQSAMQRQGDFQTDRFAVLPIQMFVDNPPLTRCFVSRFREDPPDGMSDEWALGYRREVERRAEGARVEHRAVRVAGRDAFRYEIRGHGYVNIRVIVEAERGPLVQVDYLVPEAEFRTSERAVESSLESIDFF